MANKHLVLGASVLFCAAAFAQSTPAKSDDAATAAPQQSVTTARETGSGMATGKAATSATPDGSTPVKAPRDHGSGLATGKRMHEPAKVEVPNSAVSAQAPAGTHHLESKGVIHRDLAARQASTVENSGDPHEHEVKAPRDHATGMASGKREASTRKVKGNMSNAQSNPMYKDDGKSGNNPLYENKDDKRVQSGLNATGSAVASGAAVVKTKTKSNQSNDRVAAGDVNGDGKADVVGSSTSRATKSKTKSNQSNDRVAAGDVNGDGKADAASLAKSGKITKSRSNIQNNRVSKAAGTPDPTPATAEAAPAAKPDPTPAEPQKASINTTRSNIKHASFEDAGSPVAPAAPKVRSVSMGAFDSPAAVKITKSRSNIQNNRVAAGDVNGDGAAEASAKPKADASAAADAKTDSAADSAAPAKKPDPYGNITWQSTGTGSSDSKPAAMGNSKSTPSKK